MARADRPSSAAQSKGGPEVEKDIFKVLLKLEEQVEELRECGTSMAALVEINQRLRETTSRLRGLFDVRGLPITRM